MTPFQINDLIFSVAEYSRAFSILANLSWSMIRFYLKKWAISSASSRRFWDFNRWISCIGSNWLPVWLIKIVVADDRINRKMTGYFRQLKQNFFNSQALHFYVLQVSIQINKWSLGHLKPWPPSNDGFFLFSNCRIPPFCCWLMSNGLLPCPMSNSFSWPAS